MFHIAVAPFFNKKEWFKVLVYSDGETTKCKIHCRVEDVKTKIKSGPHISIADLKREHWKIVLAIGFVAVILVTGALVVSHFVAETVVMAVKQIILLFR